MVLGSGWDESEGKTSLSTPETVLWTEEKDLSDP